MRATKRGAPKKTESARIRDLEGRVGELRGLVADLAEALCTHARTDLAPDSALPAMKRLVARARRAR